MKPKPGDVVNAVMVAWHKDSDLGGKCALGSGFAKTLNKNGEATSTGLYVREEEIVTLGIETLKPGSYIRCLVAPPDAGYETMRALEIEIYANEIEPSAQGVTDGNVF